MSMLGKRKRRSDTAEVRQASPESSDDGAAARALFQRAFEAKFKPLEEDAKPVKAVAATTSTITDDDEEEDDYDSEDQQDADLNNSDDSSETGDDWDGIDQESAPKIEIVEVHSTGKHDLDKAARSRELKAFMSSKMPSSVQTPAKITPVAIDEDDSERANLKNDLALQRLLKESHLLENGSYKSTGAEVQGKNRLKALDLRIQELGGKGSHLAQKNVPALVQKRLKDNAAEKERRRREHAAENGIILEVAKSDRKKATTRPQAKGLSRPSVGKFKDGMLKLSRQDLRGLQSSDAKGRGGKKGGRRR